ncbi:MAG TPA: hypothetical protein VJS15_08715 [Allosphingosinicella sp.]|nr:hypothetical protein [Allosphingosinicella sp.]
MAAPFLIGLLLAAAAQQVTVEALGEERFRLTIIVRADDVRAQFIGQVRLMQEAERRCGGRGRALPGGTLEVNEVSGRRGRISLSETYRCAASAEG